MSNPIKVAFQLDMTHQQTLNQRMQLLASDPSSPAEGWWYYNSVSHKPRYYNGTAWSDFSSGGGSSSPLTTKGDLWGFSTVDARLAVGSNKTVLNADSAQTLGVAWVAMDHSWISDFDTQVRLSRLDQMAAPTASVSMNSQKLTSLLAGTASTDAVNLAQLQAAQQGVAAKDAVRVIALTNATLATAYANGSTVDGITLATGDRILLAAQTTAADNGIYTVNASGAPTRAVDADASAEIKVGTLVYVIAGTASAGTQWICSATGATPWVPGSSSSTWVFFFQATATQAGAGLTAPGGNTLAVGAGTGIVVNANDVAVDPALVAKAYSQLFGDNSSTTFTITHNLGTNKVAVFLIDVTTGDMFLASVNPGTSGTSNTVALDLGATVISTNGARITVIGIV